MSEDSRWGFSQTFLTQFSASKASVEAKISEGKRSEAQQALVDLSKQLNEANEWLPAFDQRNCQTQLDTLRALVGDEAKEKPKFAFKRKAKAAASTKTLEPISAAAKTTTTSATSTNTPNNAIKDISRSIIDISSETPLSAIHIHSVNNSLIRLPDIQTGSAILHDIRNSVILFTGSCHQFRIHQAKSVFVVFGGQPPSTPIIEDSDDVRFVFPLGEEAGVEVKDFSHVKETPSPNWHVVATPASQLERQPGESEEGALTRILPLGLEN
ncbi:hypothetical protein V5O48_015945 [Marasmius crinis-equi]|uniref:C-CAP/cofactor C-like domain-containing protein n=1 Tax=Marasmius crinis-equi TaxID=585013 RepID=A0ABR3ET41_9AGAR